MDLLAQMQSYVQETYGLTAPLWGLIGLALGIALMLLLSALRGNRLDARERDLEAGLLVMAKERAAADERARQLARREERLQQAENALRSQADAFQAQVEQVRGWLDQIAPPTVKDETLGSMQPLDGA